MSMPCEGSMASPAWSIVNPASSEGCSELNRSEGALFCFYCSFLIGNTGRIDFESKSPSAEDEPGAASGAGCAAEPQLRTFMTSQSHLFKKVKFFSLLLLRDRPKQTGG